MSLVAPRTVTSSAEDVPDVDDGGEKVTAGEFWPEIVLSNVRKEMRITGAVTTSRLKQVEKRAAALATQANDHWRDARWAISDIQGVVRNSAEAF